MKKFMTAGIAAAFALAIVTAAGAQMQGERSDPSTPGAGQGMTQSQGTYQDRGQAADPQQAQGMQNQQRTQQRASQAGQQDQQTRQMAASMYLDGKQIMGSSVKDKTGKDVGKVSDLIFDRTGKVAFVIMSHGGVAGFGGKDIAIPAGAVTLSGSGEQKQVVLNVSEEQLNTAPQYTNLADLVNPTYREMTNRFFGLSPQWREGQSPAGPQETSPQLPPQQSPTSQSQSQWHIQDTGSRQ